MVSRPPTSTYSLFKHARKLTELQLDEKEDFYRLALVCKSLNSLAIPRLYSTLQVGPKPQTYADFLRRVTGGPQQKSWARRSDDLRSLIDRLVENPRGVQARSVREIEVMGFQDGEKDIASNLEQCFANLVKVLPNLQHFRFAQLVELKGRWYIDY